MDNSQLPEVWPGWKTVRVLGRGSFGAVYEIERQLFSSVEKAAVKHISLPKDDSLVESYRNDGYTNEDIINVLKEHKDSIGREYETMYGLRGNTNIVYCDDCRIVEKKDRIGWDIYIKMELLTPLMQILPKTGVIEEEKVIKLAKDICNALVLCEERNIVHRDIKPENIFVSGNGDYKLGDFGIARQMEHTTIGTVAGTYRYMAPEVYLNKPYGRTADIYSLGMVLYWILNERRGPFLQLPPAIPKVSDEEKAKTRRMNGEKLPEPAHGSDRIRNIVLKACAFNPNDRYHTAMEMLRDLSEETVDKKIETAELNETVYGDTGSIDETIGRKIESHVSEERLIAEVVAITNEGLVMKTDYGFGTISNNDMPDNILKNAEGLVGRKMECSVIRREGRTSVLYFVQLLAANSQNTGKVNNSSGDSWGYRDDADSVGVRFQQKPKVKTEVKKPQPDVKKSPVINNNKIITFHDAALETAIRNELAKNDKSILNRSVTVGDALKLKSLVVDKTPNPIKNIQDLSNFTNLEVLALRDQEIEDISPLKNLKLTTLNLGNNKLYRLEPVFSIKTLKHLIINNCGVRVFPAISEFRRRLPGCDVVFTSHDPKLPVSSGVKFVIIPFEVDEKAIAEKRMLYFRVPGKGKCLKCLGSGKIYKNLLSTEEITCPVCNGTGNRIYESARIIKERDRGKPVYLPAGPSGVQIFALPITFVSTVGQNPKVPMLLSEALKQAK